MTRANRRWLTAGLVCIALALLCMAVVDRPVAEFMDAHAVRTDWLPWLERLLHVLEAVVVAALLVLVVSGVRTLGGQTAPAWMDTPILCAWGAMWALAADVILKRVFGRGWPDPTYIADHQYGFHWLQGGPGWESFPSGTVAVAAAIVWVAWSQERRWRVKRGWRAGGSLAVLLVSAGVVVTNYHWVSDVIAGACLGAFVGALTAALRAESHASVYSTGARASTPRPPPTATR